MKTVLVVDDERDVETLFRQRFRKEIRSSEIELLFAFSGEDALQVLQERPKSDVALVLSDINMPGMTGIELLSHIKKMPPPVPVCMMTAYASDSYREQARRFECDGYLTKPIDFNELKGKIQELPDVTI
jgi:CheY-like chemotaxis protein